ncbi:unnamed protein product [Effrenium voratum]|nr:unnamed protein product [Effrenium voratum]
MVVYPVCLCSCFWGRSTAKGRECLAIPGSASSCSRAEPGQRAKAGFKAVQAAGAPDQKPAFERAAFASEAPGWQRFSALPSARRPDTCPELCEAPARGGSHAEPGQANKRPISAHCVLGICALTCSEAHVGLREARVRWAQSAWLPEMHDGKLQLPAQPFEFDALPTPCGQ